MRIANLDGRLVLVREGAAVDVGRASAGRFSSDPQAVFAAWDEFRQWATAADGAAEELDQERLGPPVPRPRQVFAVALNYRAHAAEASREEPESPLIFTKFPSCLTGPRSPVVLHGDKVDWEVELVVAIGAGGRDITREDAWGRVAGVTVGQDLSARDVQSAGSPPQFSLGKSFAGFGPTGPALVSIDELDDPDDLPLRCRLNGEEMQGDSTARMIFPVPELIARLSAVCALEPGDLIFTGTPSGVGMAREPKRFLRPGDVLESEIEGVGKMRTELTT